MDLVHCLAMDSGRDGRVRAHRGDALSGRGPQVRQQPILWVSCWACFASGLSEDELDLAMRTKDRDLQKVAMAWVRNNNNSGSLEKNPDQFSPVVRDLLTQLAELAANQSRSSIDTAA